MKNFKLLSMLLAAASLLLASCSIDNLSHPKLENEYVVTLSAQIPYSMNSRAGVVPGNGDEIAKLSYWVYSVSGSNWTYLPDLSGVKDITSSSASLSLSLIKAMEYKVVLWADAFGDAANSPYSYDPNTFNLTMDFDKITANNEALDAFYGVAGINANSTYHRHSVTLTRPFAQLNIGTSAFDTIEASGLTLSTTGIELVCANVINLKDGSVSGEENCIYTPGAPPIGYEFPYNPNIYGYISLNYILVGTSEVTSTVTFSYNMGAEYTCSINNVPLKRNRRTNIHGNIIADPHSLSISLKDFSSTSHNKTEGWDPKEDPEGEVIGGGSGDPAEDPF